MALTKVGWNGKKQSCGYVGRPKTRTDSDAEIVALCCAALTKLKQCIVEQYQIE